MGLLSRKRKRKTTSETKSMNSSNATNTSGLSAEDLEQMRTDDMSRLSGAVLVDISTEENFDKSQSHSQSRRSDTVCLNSVSQAMTERNIEDNRMETETIDPPDEQISNRWADDMEAPIGQTDTQVERMVKKRLCEEEKNAARNVADCGSIESITLINFMCHSNFHLDFGKTCHLWTDLIFVDPIGPRINFIVGRNGSGKSAILTAIVLGFGGRASTTSRGKEIRSFIKSGESQAKIIIKICNFSDYYVSSGYKVDEYGKSIIVERTINISGASTYKIKSAAGKVIAERKDVLDEIIRHYSIQVDNPVCVLNQEVSRNFLNTKNARDKYAFFMKATLLEDMKNDYSASESSRSTADNLLAEKQKIFDQTEKDVRKLEQKVNMFKELENSREKFLQLNKECFWAIVNESKAKWDAIKEEAKECAKTVEERDKKVKAINKLISDLNSDKKQAFDRMNGFVEEVGALKKTLDELKVKCDTIREQIRAKDRDDRTIRVEFATNDKDIKNLEERIERLNREFSDESYNKRKRDIESLRDEIQKLKDEEQNISPTIQENTDSCNHLADTRIKLSQECNRLKSIINEKKRNIERIDQNRNERLQRFGPKYMDLVKRIEDLHRRGEFKQKPLGPIGNHIQLKDNSCALAVELCLKRSIFAFCCDNSSDADKLKGLMQKTFGNERWPQIMIRPFVPRHDVSRYKVRSDRYKSFLDLMAIKEDAVANALIDQHRIESIVFIPDYKEAEELLMDRNTVPDNCYMAYTQDGCQMYPSTNDSDYKSYANWNQRNANFLMKSVDQMLRSLRDEVNTLSQECQKLDEQLRGNNTTLETKQRELRRSEGRRKELRNEIIKKDTKLKQLEAIGDSAPVEVSTLEEELEDYKVKQNKIEERLKVIDSEKEEIQKKSNEAEEERTAQRRQYEELLNEKEPMKENLDKIKADIQKNELIQQKYEKQLKETEKLMKEKEQELTNAEKEYEKDRNTALANSGEPIETNRSSDAVEKEIKTLEKFLDEQENSIGNKDEIVNRYKTSFANYERVLREVSGLKSHLNRLEKSLELRRRAYLEIRHSKTYTTKVGFGIVLHSKNFTGCLDIYHKDTEVNGELKKGRTLEILVNPKGEEQENSQQSTYSDTRSLSGGERSFSTVAFILALWDNAPSPFKILDEVDVFMDLMTRQISLDAMIEFAATKSGKQYIFLSPLKIQKLINPELIRIFQMPEPQRTSQRTQ